MTIYQCLRSSIDIKGVFKHNATCTVWHLSSPLLKGQVKQEKKKTVDTGAGSCSPVQEDRVAVLVRFRGPRFLVLLPSHRYLPLPAKSTASSLYFQEQQQKVLIFCHWGCTNHLISAATLGESDRDTWKIKGSFLRYLVALPAKHRQAVCGKKAYTC